MLASYFDRQDYIISVVDTTSTNKQGANIALSQRNLTRIDNIYKELNKLRILYKFNKQRNNKLIS